MSMRPLIYSVKSLKPIREALGSNDASLLERMIDGYTKLYGGEPDQDSLKRVHEMGQSFLQGDLRGNKELGKWQEAIHLLAQSLGILETEFPINDDWKWDAWDDYAQVVGNDLSTETRQLLVWLIEGRPLKASAIEADASYFAWLTTDEVERLLNELKQLEERNPDIKDVVDGFHSELVEWLDACQGNNLLVIAS